MLSFTERSKGTLAERCVGGDILERVQGKALHEVLGTNGTESLLGIEQRITDVMKGILSRLHESADYSHNVGLGNAEMAAMIDTLRELTKVCFLRKRVVR